MKIIKVSIKCIILSVETILSVYKHIHTCTHTHEHTDYTRLNFIHNLKRAANRSLRRMKTAAQNENHGRSIVLGKEMS